MTLSETFWGLADPWLFMYLSLTFLPSTLLRLLRTRQFGTLLSPSRLRDAWFSSFWAVAGPGVRDTSTARVTPLLEGRVYKGQVLDDPVIAEAVNGSGAALHGTVLEVGVGTGMWVSLLSKFVVKGGRAGNASPTTPGGGQTNGEDAGSSALRLRHAGSAEEEKRRVTRIYGIEPNAGHHAALRQQVTDAGLDGVYEVVPLGIEDITKSGVIEKESIDCIVTILCLCSIPDPEHNIQELYGYLKPGGKWYVYEHVKCSRSLGMILYQALLELFWPHIIGGCHLQRETAKWLMRAGPWTKVDLTQPIEEPWYHSVPHIWGTLTK